MKVLIVFNHPAPYKVRIFNELSKYVVLTVLFERSKAKDRPDIFYSENNYQFNAITLTDGYVFNEGSISNKVKEYIQKHHQEYDFIVMNGYSHLAEIKAIKYMKKHKIAYSLLINGGIIKEKESILKRKIKTGLIKGASFYMSTSSESNKYLKYYGADSTIYNYPYSNFSIDDILKAPIDKAEIRNKYNLDTNNKLFINASQFIGRKNNFELIKIFKDRKESLILLGDGPEKDKYLSFIKENKIENIKILPFSNKKDVFELMSCSDAFITLAKADIFGHTSLEALANGLPVISSNRVISSLEYIKDGVNGYLVDINNKEQINAAIDKVDQIKFEDVIKSVQNNTYETCGKTIYEILVEEHK